MKKAIIFDLDGTLWDACAAIADSWNEYLRNEAPDVDTVVTETDIRNACGLTMNAFAGRIFPDLPAPRNMEVTEGCCVYEVEYLKKAGGNVYEGTIETFRELKKEYPLYIVSNCQVGYIEDFLAWSGAEELIEDFENYGRTGKQKDENIRLLMERNGIDEALYVGDTQGDYESAVKAGCRFIHARYGFGRPEADTPYVNAITELPAAAREILK